MKLIVGLGNPGISYARTRHNVGFMVIDKFASAYQIAIEKKQCGALLGTGVIAGEKVLLVKPQTYMNKSGEAVWAILNYYRDGVEDLIVIHDDLDLDFGRIRFKRDGGSGGHNGLKSLTKMLNSPEYSRLKIGIGRPPMFMRTEDYVLASFLAKESEILPRIIQSAVEGLKTWCFEGVDIAMNKFNAFNIAIEKEEDEV